MCSVGRSLDQIKSVWRRLRGVLLCLFVNVRRPGLNLVTLWAPADSKTIVTFQKISFSEIHFTQKRNNETWITFHQCFSRLVHISTDQKTGDFFIFSPILDYLPWDVSYADGKLAYEEERWIDAIKHIESAITNRRFWRENQVRPWNHNLISKIF